MPSSSSTTSMLTSLGMTSALTWQLTRIIRSLPTYTARTSCSSGKRIPLSPLVGQCSSAILCLCAWWVRVLLKQGLFAEACCSAHFACWTWSVPHWLCSCVHCAAVAPLTPAYAPRPWESFFSVANAVSKHQQLLNYRSVSVNVCCLPPSC